jgi:hypothetical protein
MHDVLRTRGIPVFRTGRYIYSYNSVYAIERGRVMDNNKLLLFVEKNYRLGSLRECLINGIGLRYDNLPRDNTKCAIQVLQAVSRYLELKDE